ncbi:MAG: Minf_1886 family protein [Phycisphaeraceae bacterium]
MLKDLTEVARQTKYPIDAFLFVQRGLDFTVRQIHGEAPTDRQETAETTSRHVSGQALCTGLRDFAIQQYGLLARSVLRHWRINTTEDFGRIVFAMVEAGLMHKTADDTVRDFLDVYDFSDTFGPSLQLSGS